MRVGSVTRRRPRTAGCLVLAGIVLSGCGSTVAMTTTTTAGQVLTSQQPLSGGQEPGSGTAVTGSLSGIGTGTTTGAGSGSGGRPQPMPNGPGSGLGTVGTPPGPAPTGPLKFGLLDVGSSTDAVSALGAHAQTSVNEQNLSRAFISYLNAHGGVAGRKLQAVEYTQNSSSDNYATDMQAACARFTQDNTVHVVLRAELGGLTPENYESCLTNAGVTSLEMSYAVGDRTMLLQHPNLYNIAAPSVDRRERAVLTGLSKSGYLTSKNTIGVLVEDCPESQRAYNGTVVPLARSLGLKILERTVGCLTGFGDVGAFSSQVQAAVLPFRTAGVDRVTFVSGWETLMLLFFETNANNQGWRPSYALSSNSAIGSTVGEYSNEQRSRMRGIGWAPNTDTGATVKNATSKTCDAMARSQGITAQTQGDEALIQLVCDLFLVYKSAVETAGGRDDPSSLSAGLATASSNYLSAAVLGGRIQLGRRHQDAPTEVAEFGFVSSCSCFRYLGPPRPLP